MSPSTTWIPGALLVLASGLCGCRSQPLVEQADRLQLQFATGPTTTLYRAVPGEGAGPRRYEQTRFEGEARFTYRGAGDWSGEIADWTDSGQAISQPLGWQRPQATLALAGPDGEGPDEGRGEGPGEKATRVVMLRLGGGAEDVAPVGLALEFVSGTWADFTAGRDIVLKLEPTAFDQWVQATGGAMLHLIEQRRATLQARLPSSHWMGGLEVGEMVITEQPLIRANQTHLMVFFEPMEIEATFYILHLRRASRR
jgi:hypothetical protein